MTRFLGGIVIKIEAPDLATRRAILQARAAARGINVPEEVIAYIAEASPRASESWRVRLDSGDRAGLVPRASEST